MTGLIIDGSNIAKKIIEGTYNPEVHKPEAYLQIITTPFNTEEIPIEYLIEDIQQKLDSTDHEAIKYAEGIISEEEYAETKALRNQWREEIKALRAKMRSEITNVI